MMTTPLTAAELAEWRCEVESAQAAESPFLAADTEQQARLLAYVEALEDTLEELSEDRAALDNEYGRCNLCSGEVTEPDLAYLTIAHHPTCPVLLARTLLLKDPDPQTD